MKILGPSSASLTFDHGEVHSLSVDVLGVLHEANVSVGTAALAAALTLGRLLSEEPLDESEELAWLEAVLEFTGAYFAQGES